MIHTVGALLDGSFPLDYKKAIKDFQKGEVCSPVIAMQGLAEEFAKNQSSLRTPVYEESHQAINRDSCTKLASMFAEESQLPE